MRKKNVFIYIASPILLEWLISFAIQLVAVLLVEDIANHILELTAVISLATIPVMGVLYYRDQKRVEWKSDKEITGITVLAVIMLGVCACVALNLLISVSGLIEMSESYQDVADSIYNASKGIQILSVIVIAPIVEELVYRGLLYRRMREMVSVMPAVIFSACVFGINHGNLVQFIFATGIGALLALTYEEYRKIWVPILMHMSVNTVSLVLT